jgi:hypothetical protein
MAGLICIAESKWSFSCETGRSSELVYSNSFLPFTV